MRVTLLGTSSAEGWPALFCDCAACHKARDSGGKDIRTRSSALIDDVLKLDFPPDILHQVVAGRIDLRKLQAILFTHAHDDHLAAAELQYRGRYFVEKPLTEPLPLCGSADTIACLRNSLDPEKLALRFVEIGAWEIVSIAGYRVTAILAQHDPDQVCFNYIIEDAAGTTLLYATDTGWYEEPTWEFLEHRKLDGIVVECTNGPVEDGYMAHMSISDVVRFRTRLQEAGSITAITSVTTTHFSHLGGLMHAELQGRLSPHGISVGFDGIEIPICAQR